MDILKEDKKIFNKLMKQIRKNAKEGIRQFYERYATTILSTAMTVCHTQDKAEEVVNDVLVKVWQFAKTKTLVDNPKGWLYIVTLNTAKNAMMREKFTLPLEEEILEKKDPFQEILDEASFYWMIKDLSEIEQQIMIYKFVSHNTFQEIADSLNKALPTVTSIYYRALDKIEKKFEKNNR